MGEPATPTAKEREAAIAQAREVVEAVRNDEHSWFDDYQKVHAGERDRMHLLFVMMQMLVEKDDK